MIGLYPSTSWTNRVMQKVSDSTAAPSSSRPPKLTA